MEYYYWTLFNHGSNFSSSSSSGTTTHPLKSTTNPNTNTVIPPPIMPISAISIHSKCQNHSSSHLAPPNSTYIHNPQPSSADPLTTLKLGKRHYYIPNEDQPNKKSKPHYSEGAPRCQVEGCGTTLLNAKDYHRRHKVCQTHAKSPNVIVHGIRQRFCQQCSRFHPVGEFDDTKRSCRRRLAGHNLRRRKTSQDHFNSPPHAAGNRLRHANPLHTTRHCALSLLSSYNNNNLPHSSSDLPARCSAALRELIAENRACRQLTQIDDRDCYTTYNYKLGSFIRATAWNPSGHVTATTLAHNSGFGLFPGVNDADKNPSTSRDDEAAGCSEFWKSIDF